MHLAMKREKEATQANRATLNQNSEKAVLETRNGRSQMDRHINAWGMGRTWEGIPDH